MALIVFSLAGCGAQVCIIGLGDCAATFANYPTTSPTATATTTPTETPTPTPTVI